MSRKEYIIGSGDIRSFRLYCTAGSTHTKLYVSHIGKDEDWFFTNDEYQAEAFDEAGAAVVADRASENLGIELAIEEVEDDE